MADARGLAEALGALWRDPARAAAMRPACRQAATAEFGLETPARRHLDLYRSLRPSGHAPHGGAATAPARSFSVVSGPRRW